jgi:hypothetical protein
MENSGGKLDYETYYISASPSLTVFKSILEKMFASDN